MAILQLLFPVLMFTSTSTILPHKTAFRIVLLGHLFVSILQHGTEYDGINIASWILLILAHAIKMLSNFHMLIAIHIVAYCLTPSNILFIPLFTIVFTTTIKLLCTELISESLWTCVKCAEHVLLSHCCISTMYNTPDVDVFLITFFILIPWIFPLDTPQFDSTQGISFLVQENTHQCLKCLMQELKELLVRENELWKLTNLGLKNEKKE